MTDMKYTTIALPACALLLSALLCACSNGPNNHNDVIVPGEIKIQRIYQPGAESNATMDTVLSAEPEIQLSDASETYAGRNRYADVAMSDEERELMAKVIYLEAGNQSAEGQQAVAEVIFNRVIHSGFPDNVHDVLWEKGQFSVMPNLSCAAPGQAQYDAIDGALYGDLILDADVVFFSRGAENDRIWGRIGDHVFCREYIWG